jgi:hypothetical protein
MLLLSVLLASACCVNPFRNTESAQGPHGRPGDPDEESRRSIQPEQPAVQPADRGSDPGAGFDIRLVRVQPGVHIDTVQPCDVIYHGRPESVEGHAAERYRVSAIQRMAIKCIAPTGEGWADLVFTRDTARRAQEIRRLHRVRVRILSADGGSFNYPIVQFVALEADNPQLSEPRSAPTNVPNGFDFSALRDDPGLVGTAQQCAVSFADEIDMVPAADRRRSYPAGVQNRISIHCKHAGGEEPADLVFMPAQALAALTVRRGEVIPVRVISRNGGLVDYPILQYAGH